MSKFNQLDTYIYVIYINKLLNLTNLSSKLVTKATKKELIIEINFLFLTRRVFHFLGQYLHRWPKTKIFSHEQLLRDHIIQINIQNWKERKLHFLWGLHLCNPLSHLESKPTSPRSHPPTLPPQLLWSELLVIWGGLSSVTSSFIFLKLGSIDVCSVLRRNSLDNVAWVSITLK